MDFFQAQREREQLDEQLARGQITRDGYTAAVGRLRVTDAQGRWWQPNPLQRGWLVWNGSAWVPATPPAVVAGPASPGQAPAAGTVPGPKPALMSVHEFRKVSKEVPLAKRPQRWWDLLSILGGIAGAVIWFLYGGIRSGQEGFDLITPLLMIAIPVFLVWFRADIDKMLMPLQPTRQKISRVLLIGLGIAVPFLTAWILYNIFGISQYSLMQANIVVGTLAAYAITRDPWPVSPMAAQLPRAGNALLLMTLVLLSCLVVPVIADDCTRDPLNAQDCLRTDGYAEAMAGTVSSALAVLVNGPIVIQTLLQGGAGAGAGVQPPVPPGPATPPSQPPTPPEPPAGPTPEELKQLEAAREAARREKEAVARAAEEARRKAAEAAEKAKAGPRIDPTTGKRVLTPEQQARRAQILAEMQKNMAEAAEWESYASTLDKVVTGLEIVEKTADIAIDVGATLSPGAGSRIKNIYAATKTIGKNMSQSYADGKGLGEGFRQGVVEAATDKALDIFAGKVTDKFGGKIPGFGKYDTHMTDYGKMSVSEIKENLSKNMLKETGDIVTDLRNVIKHSDAKKAVSNAAKNAVQGQVQGASLWDPFKKFFGISK